MIFIFVVKVATLNEEKFMRFSRFLILIDDTRI